MGTVALVLLLAWLATTAIMTIVSGRLTSQHDTGAVHQLDARHLTAPPINAPDTPEKSR